MALIRVHLSTAPSMAVSPVLITAVYREGRGFHRAEWYVLIFDGPEKLIAELVGASALAKDDPDQLFTEPFLDREAIISAERALRTELLSRNHSLIGMSIRELPLSGEAQDHLKHLAIHDRYESLIAWVCDHTECDDLRALLSRFRGLKGIKRVPIQ